MYGERNGNTKISDALAIEICKLLVKHNMSAITVFNIIKTHHPECKLSWVQDLKYKKTHRRISDKYF
jgi:hypothetical protein